MGEIVSLNRARKRAAREQADTQARANRARFGRSKAERKIEEAGKRRSEAAMEQHRIEREDEI